ncbi:MAG: hypothetical protein CBC35_05745 [Planctomycetes bacterium TMED75]|nr:carbonic anhydrase [Planctomycetaceae bacterium]OUU93317.1 MAG: hypothetical protein CBC35_05745 [Planctomycetes bacterium TMED75]
MILLTLLIMAGAVACNPDFAPGATTTMTHFPQSPDEAIAELVAGNARYVHGQTTATNPPSARSALARGQAPFAAIIRCADSRVAPEIVFDQPLGTLFVTAVAGNIVTPEITASLEYSVAVLGSKLVVVMGHSGCGAVEAAIKYRDTADQLPGSLKILVDQIKAPCTLKADPTQSEKYIAEAVKCNASKGVGQLLARSQVLADAVEMRQIKIIAGVQDVESGTFTVNMG